MSEYEKTNTDLLRTSSGVGHKWRPPQNFPNMELMDNYGNFGPFFKKPAAHYKVHYLQDLHEKSTTTSFHLQLHPFKPQLMSENLRRPLTMGNQTSEMKDKFSGQDPLKEPKTFEDFKGFTLRDHLKSVPTQPTYMGIAADVMLPGGRTKSCHNRSVYLLNDPYLTTTQKMHRPFKEEELCLEPRRKLNVLEWIQGPRVVVPQQTPMTDKLFSRQETKINQIPPLVAHVPHSGFRTEYREHFQQPVDLNPQETSTCPPDIMNVREGNSRQVQTIPLFYDTEYKRIGSKCRVTV
ncbi:hypothetical protein HELRODRAFT_184048 [Helobdella robusta]|uniref:Uncharacterized protein n=1 Tax=Helobdella robusta TaxID=6412 RepID=T1FKH4_HELRO|nr:hypothetical protein HELRODRAFT_184048 [Helobdella robusta]ESO08672.1 hypothetical protein HELRODRAFT_184048 [Helobdella robusta]